MSTIVTHPGSAHRDEFMACCLAIAAGKCGRIERRDSTDEDLNDPNVIVLDQGSRHEPALLNFDHHQFGRDADPACSITLILPYLGIDVEKARSIWGWLEFSELLDSKGPFATAEKLGSTPDALFAGVSPVETTVLRWFEEVVWMEDDCAPLYALMHRIGKEKLDYLAVVVERHERLDREAIVYRGGYLPRQGSWESGCDLPSRELPVDVIDATCIPRDENPVMGLEAWVGTRVEQTVVTITQDDRGEGLCLFRRNDDPRIDFSMLEGEGGVVFAHKGGFVAKLAAGVDPLPMIEKAVVVTCGV